MNAIAREESNAWNACPGISGGKDPECERAVSAASARKIDEIEKRYLRAITPVFDGMISQMKACSVKREAIVKEAHAANVIGRKREARAAPARAGLGPAAGGRGAMDRHLRGRAAPPVEKMRAETDAAIGAARLARQIADSRAGADAVQFKQGIDIVTAADVCEDAIREELARSFPDHPVVGEERGGEPRGGEPYWLVDPICGTRCYASDVPLYCTNIALVEREEVTTAVIAIGRSNELLYAEKGGGAWLIADGDATRMSTRTAAPEAAW